MKKTCRRSVEKVENGRVAEAYLREKPERMRAGGGT